MIGFKLVRLRKDGTLGPLFINRKHVLDVGHWMKAEDHPTKGYAHRPGWHVLANPIAPHLSKKGRVWVLVEVRNFTEHERPASQGGRWFLADEMRVIRIIDTQEG